MSRSRLLALKGGWDLDNPNLDTPRLQVQVSGYSLLAFKGSWCLRTKQPQPRLLYVEVSRTRLQSLKGGWSQDNPRL